MNCIVPVLLCSLWILSAIDLRSLLKKGCVMCCTAPATRTRPTGPSSPPRPAPGQAQKGPSQEWCRAPNLDCAKVCTCLHRVKMVYYKRPSVVNINNQKHQLTSLCARFATKLTLAVTERHNSLEHLLQPSTIFRADATRNQIFFKHSQEHAREAQGSRGVHFSLLLQPARRARLSNHPLALCFNTKARQPQSP